jgi:hypothetical protein
VPQVPHVRLVGEIYDQVVDGRLVLGAVYIDRPDVAAVETDDGGCLGERARSIGQGDSEPDEMTHLRERSMAHR